MIYEGEPEETFQGRKSKRPYGLLKQNERNEQVA